MKQRLVGSSGLRVSRFGLGTLGWGTLIDRHEAAGMLGTFIDAGGTLLDTASSYGGGASEQTIGELLADGFARPDLVLTTKAGVRTKGGSRRVDTSRRSLLEGLDESLGRMGVDHLDLWQVEAWDPSTPIEETLSALDTAVSSGRVRYVGVSNFGGWQTSRAATVQLCRGAVPLVSSQVEYSLLQRGVEREAVPAARAAGIGILPWSPLGRGVLSGKYRTGIPADSRAAGPWAHFVEPLLTERSARIVEAVCKAAEGLELSPTEVALAWVRDRPGVVAPVVGARTVEQLRGWLTTERVTLPAEIVRALDDVSAIELGYPEA
jgi:aryl-alcohol dehydrogenase-like predicted oxidoreductase